MSIDISSPYLAPLVEASKRIIKSQQSGKFQTLYFTKKNKPTNEENAFYLHCERTTGRKDIYDLVVAEIKQKEKSETE